MIGSPAPNDITNVFTEPKFQCRCQCTSTYPRNSTWPTTLPSAARCRHWKCHYRYQKIKWFLNTTVTSLGSLLHAVVSTGPPKFQTEHSSSLYRKLQPHQIPVADHPSKWSFQTRHRRPSSAACQQDDSIPASGTVPCVSADRKTIINCCTKRGITPNLLDTSRYSFLKP